MLDISKITNITNLRDSILRDRATRAQSCRSREFIALVHGKEAGLLSYEDWSDRGLAFVYEIFVLAPFRKQGLGTELLSYAEQYAVQLNCNHIRLKPHALDQEPDQSRLKAWYARLGYRDVTGDPEQHMEKLLPKQGVA